MKVGKRIRLTAAGQRYHDSRAAAFESLRIAQVEVERSKNASNLRISVVRSLLSDWLAPHIYAWQDEHPELNLFLDGSHAGTFARGLRHLMPLHLRRLQATENAIELFRDCVVPVCSPWLLRPDVLLNKPADLLAYPLLSIDWLPKFASASLSAGTALPLAGIQGHGQLAGLVALGRVDVLEAQQVAVQGSPGATTTRWVALQAAPKPLARAASLCGVLRKATLCWPVSMACPGPWPGQRRRPCPV